LQRRQRKLAMLKDKSIADTTPDTRDPIVSMARTPQYELFFYSLRVSIWHVFSSSFDARPSGH
jgi:hypothetical protein